MRTLIIEKTQQRNQYEEFNKFLIDLAKSNSGFRRKLVYLKKYMQAIKVCNCQTSQRDKLLHYFAKPLRKQAQK